MAVKHVIIQGLFYATVVNVYLFIFMITTSPRIWGYSDYPEVIKNKVPPQTKKEKIIGALVGLPWLIFVLGFPVYSTYTLKMKLGNEISFWTAFLNFSVLFLLANIGDVFILDWLIISRITPKFVIIPGTEEQDYKDFSHHFKGHMKATIGMVLLGLIMAGIIWYF